MLFILLDSNSSGIKPGAVQDAAVDADLVKELAHLLFRVAEDNGWTKDALSFNTLVTSWPEVVGAAGKTPASTALQQELDLSGDDY